VPKRLFSHRRAAPSRPTLRTIELSPLKVAYSTPAPCPIRMMYRPRLLGVVSHSRTPQSALVVVRREPSGLNATAVA
jgi:hypothetical protein